MLLESSHTNTGLLKGAASLHISKPSHCLHCWGHAFSSSIPAHLLCRFILAMPARSGGSVFSRLQDITGQMDIKQTSTLVACLYCMLTSCWCYLCRCILFTWTRTNTSLHEWSAGLDWGAHGSWTGFCGLWSDRNCSHKSGCVTWTVALSAAALSDSWWHNVAGVLTVSPFQFQYQTLPVDVCLQSSTGMKKVGSSDCPRSSHGRTWCKMMKSNLI